VMAQNLGARCFGAKSNGGVGKIIFNDKLEIENVIFTFGAETGVYDYRVSTGALKSMPSISAELKLMHTGNIYRIPVARDSKGAVYDMKGRLIAPLEYSQGNLIWDSSHLPPAMYVARILEEGKSRAIIINKIR
ncbi:MAG: hypothetical protein NTY68_00080, partial [Candidatus Micrarchaeota archaeon]|nr:hypothetical protein [Candidatus Micrarchaeota archaeon]